MHLKGLKKKVCMLLSILACLEFQCLPKIRINFKQQKKNISLGTEHVGAL